MLYRELLIEELNRKRDDFRRFAESQSDELESYVSLLKEIGKQPSAEIAARLGAKDDVGALPSDEIDRFGAVKIDFAPRWRSHEEARAWAVQILKNRTTFAADGSQIQPGREISLPVAAVQVGTFENRHNEQGEYRKQAHLEIISPGEFFDSDLLDEKPVRAETLVGFVRFAAEIRHIKKFLQAKSGWRERGEPMPLAFLDNTLLLSIALPQTKLQNRYISEIVELVRASEESEVPVVGFVDESYAHDLIHLLDNFAVLHKDLVHVRSERINDAGLLGAGTLKNWGERTAFFYSRRAGLSEFFTDADGNSTVGFVYLQTASDVTPARLDVPAWVYERGLLEEVVDTVRAETVIGLGYPYALETADATAVISTRDRETFLRAFQDFAARENLNFRISNKKMSKARRR